VFGWVREKVGFLIHHEKEPYLSIYRITGVFPHNLSLYNQAFRHRSSYLHSKPFSGIQDNERLEFLGDAILSTVIAEMLYKLYPSEQEGFLTRTRAKIVQRETMQRVALALGIDRIMYLSGCVRLTSHNNYVYGNALEALIAAIYLDRGYKACYRFIQKVIVDQHLNLNKLIHEETNFKSALIEWAQKKKMNISFEVESFGYDNNRIPVFRSKVTLDDRPLGIGNGHSKKESQQKAAEEAIKSLHLKK
jgi:ribonuclease-3